MESKREMEGVGGSKEEREREREGEGEGSEGLSFTRCLFIQGHRVGWVIVLNTLIIHFGFVVIEDCLCWVQVRSTGSALAEDVIQKSEIIKTYFMETKAG